MVFQKINVNTNVFLQRKQISVFIIPLSFLTLSNLYAQRTIPIIKEIIYKKDTFIVKTNFLCVDNKTQHGMCYVMLRVRKIYEEYFSKLGVTQPDQYMLENFVENPTYNKLECEDSTFYYFLVSKGKFTFGIKDSIWCENFGWHFYQEGRYENGVKTGHWQEFYEGRLCAEGIYKQDRKSNIWNYHPVNSGSQRDPFMIYNYDLDSIVYLSSRKESDENIFAVNIDKKCSTLVRQPVFPYGGHYGLLSIIANISTYKAPNSLFGFYNTTLIHNVDNTGICDTKISKVKRGYRSSFTEGEIQEKDDECFLAHKTQQIITNLPKYWIKGKNCENGVKILHKFRFRFE